MKKITKNKEKRLMNFAQELSWVFESFKDVSFKDIYEFFSATRYSRYKSYSFR